MAKKQKVSNRPAMKSPESIEYRVQIGKTDDFRYVGVQPPFEKKSDSQSFAAVLDDYFGDYFHVLDGHTKRPDQGNPYTVFTVMGSPDDAWMVAAAQRAIDTVLHPGESAQVDDKIRGIGYGHYLFGGQDVIEPA